MRVFERVIEDRFPAELSAYLIEHHGGARVFLPAKEPVPLRDLSRAELERLVSYGIKRAKKYGLAWKSSLTAFVAIMFEISPNFDSVPMIATILQTKLDQMSKIDSLMRLTNLRNWELAVAIYDPKGWLIEAERDAR